MTYSRGRERVIRFEDGTLRSFPANLRHVACANDEDFAACIGAVGMCDCSDERGDEIGLLATASKIMHVAIKDKSV